MTSSDPNLKASRLGYQLPLEAKSESERAHQVVAEAVDIRWVKDGAVLLLPDVPLWSDRIDRFVQEFSRRHPDREVTRCDSGVDGHLALRVSGVGAERWLRSSVARSHPGLGTRIRRRVRLNERLRSLTRSVRVLPSFVIIGGPRCGTTSLFHTLMRHPSISPPARKELAFFNVLHKQGLPWYRSQFPMAWERFVARRRTGAFATGDATPTYLFHPHAARRIRSAVPDARLIVLLRDPVDRAYSHYQWALTMGYEMLPFEAAVEMEEERTQGELDRMLSDEGFLSFPRSYLSYLAMGSYAEQLEAWRAVFSEEQLLVLLTADMKRHPEQTLSRTLLFLGLPEASLAIPERNTSSYPPMQATTRARLKAHFKPQNERLAELLGRDPGW